MAPRAAADNVVVRGPGKANSYWMPTPRGRPEDSDLGVERDPLTR